MAENTLEQIVDELRSSGSKYFAQHSDVKAVRVVGHTPKPDHYTYEIVVDFVSGGERVNAKLYRGKAGAKASRSWPARKLRICNSLIRPPKSEASRGCHGPSEISAIWALWSAPRSAACPCKASS